MNYRIVRAASAELEETVAYYNRQVPGLGYEFAEAVDRIQDFPHAWPRFENTIRRYRLARFPYGVVYHIQDDTLLIVGLMHLAMDPAPWRERMRGIDEPNN